MSAFSRSAVVATGITGLIGAILTGTGEFVLHFDPLARYGAENEFLLGISPQRSTVGHFIAVFGAPLCMVGCWHLRLMLQPASERWSLVAFFTGALALAIGLVWIGSRASLNALINMPPETDVAILIDLYDLRYETLIQVVRVAVLLLSVVFVWLVLTGRSMYPKWMALLNPILLIAASFAIYLIAPAIGKYLMPIALNVAFSILFLVSLVVARKKGI